MGVAYLRVDGVILPIYMLLFAITSFLQAMKRPIWTVWISLYRQGFGVAFFIWVFVGVLGFSEIGVWFGVAAAVSTGALIAVFIAERVAQAEIGGLFRPVPPREAPIG